MPYDRLFIVKSQRSLRYGENPHQEGSFLEAESDDPLALQRFTQLQGKELSFNNYLDSDGALYAIAQIGVEQPACVVIKHTNPCGAAVANDIVEAYRRAWEGDSLAAFGGIIAINRPVDAALAAAMLEDRKFFEVLLAPEVEPDAARILAAKPDLRVLVNPALLNPTQPTDTDVKRVRGGFLVQAPDAMVLTASDLEVVTAVNPTPEQVADLLFAWQVCRASKSNTIVIAKDGMLVGSGVGQQDRKRCCELAVSKSMGRSVGAVAASDAFFPFPDGPQVLIDGGVKAIIQPGGSIRDKDTIDLCDRYGVAMVFNGGIRCFRH